MLNNKTVDKRQGRTPQIEKRYAVLTAKGEKTVFEIWADNTGEARQMCELFYGKNLKVKRIWR